MRKMITKVFFVLCVMAAVGLDGCSGGGGGGGGGAGGGPTASSVALSPSSGTVAKGAEFTRTVEVKNIGKTFYVAFDVTYDPKVVQYINAEENSFLNQNDTGSTSFQAALENGAEGRITIGLTQLSREVSGSGTLLTLHFKAVGSGTTPLSFSDPKGFMNSANKNVTIDSWEDGAVTVQ